MPTASFGGVLEGVTYTLREAVYGIFADSSGRIALIKTPRGYFLPGGGIEHSETHAECLVRESLEETGYAAEVRSKICTASFFDFVEKLGGYYQLLGHFYFASFKHDSGVRKEDDKALEWLDSETASRVLRLPHQAWAVREASSHVSQQEQIV